MRGNRLVSGGAIGTPGPATSHPPAVLIIANNSDDSAQPSRTQTGGPLLGVARRVSLSEGLR